MKGTLYRVLSGSSEAGGKLVRVFPEATGDLQAIAAQANAPLSAFIQQHDDHAVKLRVFTPCREKGASDSAALAALTDLHTREGLPDNLEVMMGDERLAAQRCGDEWLLRQGTVLASEVTADLSPTGLGGHFTWKAQIERPNLIVELPGTPDLDTFQPDAEAISTVNYRTSTTGLILFTLGGPRRADVSFRAFGPLKGFLEDAASSNMLACLIGVLGEAGQRPKDTNLIRAAQRMPGTPALMTAQYKRITTGWDVWVGGSVFPIERQAKAPAGAGA